ncbi:MAG TPA: class I SAM-dependent methyltransferase [Bacillota bacterium]|nr:class I SAM-dependent methyltransferase [Bacillota bacterium]
MLKLSDRLQKIADFIEPGESVADIGTDHGFLPVALWESEKSPRVILSDINAGPLEKAKANIDKHFPGKEFDLRIGSGIRTLKPAEVDVIVIAGMGGLLIADILGDDLEKSKTYPKLILQPRNAQDKLRGWLLENGFTIRDEALVRERKYLCEIIVAMPYPSVERFSDIDLEISPILFEKKDPLLIEFIENKIRIEMKVYDEIQAGAKKDKAEKLAKSAKRLESLLDLKKRRELK